MKMKYSDPALSVANFSGSVLTASAPQTDGASIVANIMKTGDMGDGIRVETLSLSEFKMEE